MKEKFEFVLDASVALTWLYRDGDQDYMTGILSLINDDARIYVPPLWLYEIMNGAVMAVRHKNYDSIVIERFLEEMAALPIRFHAPSDWNLALLNALSDVSLAIDNGLTAYDNAYLVTAMQLQLPLATLDKDLRRAARAAGIADVIK